MGEDAVNWWLVVWLIADPSSMSSPGAFVIPQSFLNLAACEAAAGALVVGGVYTTTWACVPTNIVQSPYQCNRLGC